MAYLSKMMSERDDTGVHYIADLFWKILTQEYLPLLQEQQKWIGLKRRLKIGDIVLVVDPFLPRNSWILGKITKVMPEGTV